MRTLFSICLLVAFSLVKAQEVDTYQEDSIYSRNRISSRTMYAVNIDKLRKELVTTYNPGGQITTRSWFWNGESKHHNQEIFYYSKDGLLASIVDSHQNGNIETTTFHYDGSILKYRFTLNQKKDTTDLRVYPGENTAIHRWYSEGKPYRFDTTVFERRNVKLNYYGLDSRSSNKDSRWNYNFKNEFDLKGNLIKVRSRVEDPFHSFVEYFYDDRNLLINKKEVMLIKDKQVIRAEYRFEYE